jgi:hypothetical protein
MEGAPAPRVLSLDDAETEQVVRILAASVNIRLMSVLVEARRNDPEEGWRFLSELAEAVDERPGTVGLAVQKLLPLLEERRHKGKRYFRSRYKNFEIHLDPY